MICVINKKEIEKVYAQYGSELVRVNLMKNKERYRRYELALEFDKCTKGDILKNTIILTGTQLMEVFNVDNDSEIIELSFNSETGKVTIETE